MQYFHMRRGWLNHEFFGQQPYSERDAWCWLIQEAAFADRVIEDTQGPIELERGELAASLRFMAEHFSWSRSKVSRYLDRLAQAGMIGKRMTRSQRLIITIRNYDQHQGAAALETVHATVGATVQAGPDALNSADSGRNLSKPVQRSEGADVQRSGVARNGSRNGSDNGVDTGKPGNSEHDEPLHATDSGTNICVIENPNTDSTKTTARAIQECWRNSVSEIFAQPPRPPRPDDFTVAHMWVQAGATLELCRGIFERTLMRRRDRNESPPTTLKYFDTPVRDAIPRQTGYQKPPEQDAPLWRQVTRMIREETDGQYPPEFEQINAAIAQHDYDAADRAAQRWLDRRPKH